MAWNETTILNRAKEMARTYCDEDRITTTDVRAVVQEFCLNTRAIYGTETFTTNLNQRVYDLSRVFEVVRVRYQNNPIPQGYRDGSQSYQVRPSQVVLNFNPVANASLEVSGYIVPTNVSDINLQPEVAWMDAMAHLVAARVLRRYGDAQAVSRSRDFEQQGLSLVDDLYRRLVQPFAPRPDATSWNVAYVVHRAREILHPHGLSGLVTDADAEAAIRIFLLTTRAHRAETTHTTVANQKRYSLGDVVFPQEVVYDGAEIALMVDAPYTQSWYTDGGQLVLNFEPAAGKNLMIRGYGMPANIGDIKLTPSDSLMDAIACKIAGDMLMRYGRDKDTTVRAQYLLTQYAQAVNDVSSRMGYTRLQRGDKPTGARVLKLT